MKNDAKLGMLVGVLGVIVAAVLFVNTPPPTAQSRPDAAGEARQKDRPPATATATAVPALAPATPAALPSTPVVRTRKEPEALPASRSNLADEEP